MQMSDHESLILTVDDDPNLLDIVEDHIRAWGYNYCGVTDSAKMWEELERVIPSVILLDMKLGDDDGIALVSELKQRLPFVPIIMITAYGTIKAAIKSIKCGAYDFVCKPLDFDHLHIEINRAIEHNYLSLKVNAFQCAKLHTDFHGMVGRSEPMRKIYRLIDTVAATDTPVLILGETGTGKELAARAIHECSKRCNGPFVAVNAPAIPHELIESALFGHEKGAFTGAEQRHLGFCEQANGGTLFLDEICETDYNVQAKLLRFLEDYVVQPVGAKSPQVVDVRVIAATNRNPSVQMQNNKLREDLYYRLSVISIELAPLREHPSDIALLVHYFLNLAAAKYGKTMCTVSSKAMRLFETHDWPGNVRQLQHFIDQIVITTNSTELTAEMLLPEITKQSCVDAPCTDIQIDEKPDKIIPSIPEMEQRLILEALELTSGSVPKAAGHLGLSEATLYRKIKRFGLARTFVKQQ
jgi:DNA-binding NtrC family response regulator